MTVLVRAAALSNYAEVAREVGLDPRRMLRRAKLEPSVLANPDTRIPVAAVVALLETSAEQSGCISFGLRMAESRQLSDFGAISLLMKHQRTLRDILAIVARYRQLLNEALAIHLEELNDLLILREERVSDGKRASRQCCDLARRTGFRAFRWLLSERWR